MNNKICMCCGKILSDENMYWHPSCIKKMFDSYSIPKIDINEDKIIDENLNAGNIVTGVQKKFSLDINVRKARKTVSVMNQEYIIKTQQANLNNIVYYEWIGMKLANICGIDTVDCGIIKNNNDLLFITKRIDRQNNKKIPMEDFCQLSNSQTEYKYNGSYERCYKNVINKYSMYQNIDKLKFYKIILFSYIIGNTDMHLKNFSLYEIDGKYQLTPAYDLVPVLMIFNQDEMALSINGKRKNITKNDFYQFGLSMDIDKKFIDLIHNDFKKNRIKMNDFINHTDLNNEEKIKFINFINDNINKLCE